MKLSMREATEVLQRPLAAPLYDLFSMLTEETEPAFELQFLFCSMATRHATCRFSTNVPLDTSHTG